MKSNQYPRAKKSLGQNFLVDEKALERIASHVPEATRLLLEIGPGRGALTAHLAQRTKKLFLLEKDEELLAGTRTMLRCEGVEPAGTWEADALDFDYAEIWRVAEDAEADLVVAANLPYNVATEILFRLLNFRERIPLMVLMFQKEVGLRIAAKPGGRAFGIISVFVQNFYEVEEVLRLKPASFRPQPKVESSVLLFRRREHAILDFGAAEWEEFRVFVQNAFRHRRKTLENSLKMSGGGLAKGGARGTKNLAEALLEAGIDGRRRAETLSIPELGALFRCLHG